MQKLKATSFPRSFGRSLARQPHEMRCEQASERAKWECELRTQAALSFCCRVRRSWSSCNECESKTLLLKSPSPPTFPPRPSLSAGSSACDGAGRTCARACVRACCALCMRRPHFHPDDDGDNCDDGSECVCVCIHAIDASAAVERGQRERACIMDGFRSSFSRAGAGGLATRHRPSGIIFFAIAFLTRCSSLTLTVTSNAPCCGCV